MTSENGQINLIKYPDRRTQKHIWFYVNEEYTVVSPYFTSEEEAYTWKESEWEKCGS